MEPPGPEYVSLLSGWRTTLDLRGGQEGRAGWFSCHGLSGRQDQNRGGSMAKIKVIHDSIAHILTVWTGDPTKGAMCEETTDEVVLMKDIQGHVIGIELLHY